jgi:CubicO group peptidase (beta-lactamase class C family)
MHRLIAAGAAALFSIALIRAQSSSIPEIVQIENGQPSATTELGPLTLVQLMAKYHVPGISVAVIKDFRILWAKGYGTADVVSSTPVDSDTIFQAASISKPVAAMAVLKTVQDGRFTLDTDINAILTSWKLPTDGFTADGPVTPRALLSHTSGLDDGFGFPGYAPGAPLPTLVQILNGQQPSNTGPVRMARPPFSGMKYSGGGVMLMQLAMIDTLKKPFPKIMDQLVLEPLGMAHSRYEQPLTPDHDRHAARGHDREGKARDAKWHVYPELEAAGLWTTPSDLATFLIEVQQSIRGRSNRVLSQKIAEEMTSPVGVGDYAVGLGIGKQGEGWYISHSGGNWGFICDMRAHKLKGYGVAIMTNADSGGPVVRELENRVATVYHWDTFDKPIPR